MAPKKTNYPRPARSMDHAAGSLTLKRHTSCSSCSCPGQHPASNSSVVLHDGHSAGSNWQWECECEHEGVEGHERDEDQEERQRRLRVAKRIDELLQDEGKLQDFGFVNEDVKSLRKQMLPASGRHPERSVESPRPSHLGERKRGRDVSASQSPAPGSSRSSAAGRESHLQKKRKTLIDRGQGVDSAISSRASSLGPLTPSADDEGSATGPRIAGTGEIGSSDEASTAPEAIVAEGEGHGKRPARSQKGLPEATEGAANPISIEVTEQPKPSRDEIDRGADLDAAVKGSSIDAGWLDEPEAPRKERPAVIEERAGLIQFRVVENDGRPESMIILTGLKNIFQRQLPKMPREYITRLVLDRNHRSMAIVKRGLQVVGGITYRPFEQKRFAEIVFCAISSTEQVKGYGNHLMNHVKDYVKDSSEVMHFLTYADNYAIGYFKKQGFTKEITLPRSQWVGYIKDYEGGTLMQCSMVPRVRYLGVTDLLAQQRRMILQKIRQISRSHIVHKGLDVFRKKHDEDLSKREAEESSEDEDVPLANSNHASTSSPSASSKRKKFAVDPAEVPGLKESAWTPEMDEISRRPKRGPHHALMRHVLVELNNHHAAWPFTAPVDAASVHDYYSVIKQPMDLSTMETKLENNAYATVEDLTADFRLVAANCRQYNGPSNSYTKLVNTLEKHFDREIGGWKQSYGVL
ncbi:Bromodomain-domain-containing protein [Ceraceosorus guamensis]|uniref:histone acetyltransferase n=1 Tax=Ceraceosorus guamensis TaxID=1522189 RepID=A0A316W905_9BASI|nr:Bromodomain-domain-containing protein [Ceraceosorus guamensis]PWN46396.1 Bromodomain-domain-containing protein [Ceraceosorus guamensis]